jgi:hypothetical protein
MSKFLLNLLVQISKALVYSKIQFLIRKFFFLISGRPPPLFFFFSPAAAHLLPPGPAQSDRTGPFSKLVRFRYLSIFSTSKLVRFGLKICLIRSLRPQAASRALGPLSPSHVGVFTKRRILFDFAHSGRDAFSLSRHCHVGPACHLHPLPPRRSTVATRHLQPPQPPTSRCQARSSLHVLISPLISLLNPSSSRPAINGVKAITVGRFALPRPGVPLPGHYKRTRSTPLPSLHSPHPQSLASESAAPTPPSASSAAPSCSR